MIVTVASHKGGVGKTTTAIHLANYFSELGSTLLIDGDLNRSALSWSRRGRLPYDVVDERQAARAARGAEHVVIDTQARPERADLEALAGGCDLLVVPTSPEMMALETTIALAEELKTLAEGRFRILLTLVPPKPSRDGEEARALLEEAGLPVFRSQIRRAVAFTKAALAGVPVNHVLQDPRHQACWMDYVSVGDEIREELGR